MKVIFDNETISVKKLSLTQWRQLMSELLQLNPIAGQVWDLMGTVRGPDFPSETSSSTPDEYDKLYRGRRNRKFKTVEILRNSMFFGVIGGGARSHYDDTVTLPHPSKWDHFDRHVARSAEILGLKIKEG